MNWRKPSSPQLPAPHCQREGTTVKPSFPSITTVLLRRSVPQMPSTGSNSISRNSGSVLSQTDPAEAGHSSPLLEILSKPGHLDRVAQNLQVISQQLFPWDSLNGDQESVSLIISLTPQPPMKTEGHFQLFIWQWGCQDSVYVCNRFDWN